MVEEQIAQIGIDDKGRLFVQPEEQDFPYIYRAAMEVRWDSAGRKLISPKPREWSYLDWFRQIVAAAADEYGVYLKVGPRTTWIDIPEDLRREIESIKAPPK